MSAPLRVALCAVVLWGCRGEPAGPPPPPPGASATPARGSAAAAASARPRELRSFHGLAPGQRLGAFVLERIVARGPAGALLRLRLDRDLIVYELQPEGDPRPAPARAAGMSIYFWEPRRGEVGQQEIDDGLRAIAHALAGTARDGGGTTPDAAAPPRDAAPGVSL